MKTQSAPLTDVEKIRRLPWLVAGDSLNTGFFLLTFSGSVFVLFLSELNFDSAQIGFMLSLVPFVGIVSPFIAPWVARFGYKRTFITFWGTRNVVFAFMLLTPLVLAQFGQQVTFWWVAAIIFLFALCRAIAETGGYPWRKEATPDSIRGKFIALNSMSTTVAGVLVTIGAGFVIDAGTGLNRFIILITVGLIFGFTSVWVYAHVPGGAAAVSAGVRNAAGNLRGMRHALKNRNFLLFLLALGLGAVGATAMISFIPLYMKEYVGLSEGSIVLLSVSTYLGALVSSYWWGWAADRYGSQPIMQFSLFLLLVLPVAWFLMPHHSPLSLPVAFLIAFVAGLGTLAWRISWMRYLYVNAVPPDNATHYTSVYYAWFGLISGVGPLVIGQILRLSDGSLVELGPARLTPYTPVFALSVFLLAAGIWAVSRLSTEDATPFGRLAGMFLRGNPIRALQSLVRYNFAASEDTLIAVAEQMGDAGNPLSSVELIEALNDPSFNVRYEAIHSIGRLPAEPELVDALLDALGEDRSELSFVVTRSLGRLGDRRAVPALRRLLFSGYHLLEANAARALSLLGDEESIPDFLEKLERESNPVLKIAYASALGKLRAAQAIDPIFALLAQTVNPIHRGEIGLALARIAGDEAYYLQHWRSLRANHPTSTAQAVLALQKLARSANQGNLADSAESCAAAFAQNQAEDGAAHLQHLLQQFAQAFPNTPLTDMMTRCAAALAQFGDTRLEIILLSLHTLDVALHQMQTGAPSRAGYALDFPA